MEGKQIYYYSSQTMRQLMESINAHNIRKDDIITIFHDGENYIVVYEL